MIMKCIRNLFTKICHLFRYEKYSNYVRESAKDLFFLGN